jgi:hypothetical protein
MVYLGYAKQAPAVCRGRFAAVGTVAISIFRLEQRKMAKNTPALIFVPLPPRLSGRALWLRWDARITLDHRRISI